MKFAFRAEKYGVPYFWPKAERSKAPTERDRRSKSAERGRGFKWRAPTRSVGRRPFKPQTALLPRKDVRGARNESGVRQTRHRSDFKRTWVRLGERGRRGCLEPRRGESLFSRSGLQEGALSRKPAFSSMAGRQYHMLRNSATDHAQTAFRTYYLYLVECGPHRL